MTDHIHMLIERRADSIGQIMHRFLTGYTQYFNRRTGRVGHVMQGRHKAILCQAETYMGQLVRYIHLNPVRAKMVGQAEDYPYSSHRAFLDLEPAGIVDVDPVLRLFGTTRSDAAKRFAQYVNGARDYDEEFEYADGGRILGSEEFVDATIHRLGNTGQPYKPTDGRPGRNQPTDLNHEALIAAVEHVFDTPREYFVGQSRYRNAVRIKEVLLLSGCRLGASLATLSKLLGLSSASTSRRHDHARRRLEEKAEYNDLVTKVTRRYRQLT